MPNNIQRILMDLYEQNRLLAANNRAYYSIFYAN